jgi:inhibitor of cysteine peptidase
MVIGQAVVESVDILILESFPVQVRAIAKGYHPDPCTKTKEITQKREGNTFEVTITTERDGGQACIQVISPFEENLALDVVGLDAGTYTVTINGVSAQFTLDVDNVLR